ncbi:MAG: FHA domain-containing protein [Myxococcota bacterium]
MRTRREAADLPAFLTRWEATLVVERGKVAGTEYALEQPKVVLGRGQDADVHFDDTEMSAEHAVVEFTGEGFRVCDLGSTNGTRVNGEAVNARDLEGGDRLELGRHALRLRIEPRSRAPRVYCLPDD